MLGSTVIYGANDGRIERSFLLRAAQDGVAHRRAWVCVFLLLSTASLPAVELFKVQTKVQTREDAGSAWTPDWGP